MIGIGCCSFVRKHRENERTNANKLLGEPFKQLTHRRATLVTQSLSYLIVVLTLSLHCKSNLSLSSKVFLFLGALLKRSKGYTCARGLEVKSLYDK